MWPYIVGTSSLHEPTLTLDQIKNYLDSHLVSNYKFCILSIQVLELELSCTSYGEVNVKFLFFLQWVITLALSIVLIVEPRMLNILWICTNQSHCNTCLFNVHSWIQSLAYAIQLYIEVLNKEEWLAHLNSKVKRFCVAKKLHDIAKFQLSLPLSKRINNSIKGRK
jgi:hypothetical protein